MIVGQIDLAQLLRRLADRDQPRTEANVQSDLHMLLLTAPLQLSENHLRDLEVVLEQQAGSRKRIDVEAGLCVFEVKRDLRKGNVRADAEQQLSGYVELRTRAMKQRYVGVLTDGAEWHLYYLAGLGLQCVSSFHVEPARPDVEGLSLWLEGVLATSTKIAPTPQEITRRLGAATSGHHLDYAELAALYQRGREQPTVKLKRELWARLLTTAFGTGFTDDDKLFVEHTLLVVTAEVIAHAVMGFELATEPPAAILSGQLFTSAGVHGVVESDFFDWVIEVPEGDRFVKELARRLSRFAWHAVQHDVLKILYESVISTEQRKKLGEYYTPDWLAEHTVDATVAAPLKQRVLDPACGSGTFLFHAIRRYLVAADEQGLGHGAAIAGITQNIVGMDIHPVAVTFARVTYLLAIGPRRLQADDRPPISVPVYLGDSIQWGQERTLFTHGALVIPTVHLLQTDLRFPERVLGDAAQFDRLVGELTDLAARRQRGSAVPSLKAFFRRYAVQAAEQPTLAETFKTLCQLYDQGRDHIWGYYVRNLARPVWLTRPENRVDVLVGNPPWLAYRFMTADMQAEFRALCEERDLWAGSTVATNQDLSGLFVLRAIERYLRDGGRFGFVMPWSVLRGRQFAGFRTGQYSLKSQKTPLTLAFDQAWDLHGIKPSFFPVPACVVLGHLRAKGKAVRLPSAVESWKGRLPQTNLTWEKAVAHITRGPGVVREAVVQARSGGADGSPYQERFAQGATVVPRVLFVVDQKSPGPLGAGGGRVSITSRRSANEKLPWKSLPPLSGNLERQFVRPMHMGETILPYRPLEPLRAVVPWDGKRLLDSKDDRLGMYPGLEEWWLKAERTWNEHRSTERLTLLEQLDFRHKLTQQFPIPPYRIIYAASGMYLAAAIVSGQAIIEHGLYWGTATCLDEARYLEAVLNSDALTQAIRPLQARGEHNPRHYDKYVWQVPVPMYDEKNQEHQRLAELAEQAERIAKAVQLPAGRRFEALRRMVREAIAATETGREIEAHVSALLR